MSAKHWVHTILEIMVAVAVIYLYLHPEIADKTVEIWHYIFSDNAEN